MRLRVVAWFACCWFVLPLDVFAQGSIRIASLQPATIESFGVLTVNGSGFDPARSALSIIVTPRGGARVTIPVHQATSSSLAAVVPPLFSTAGALFDAPVVASVQVVQVNRSNVRSSNVLASLTINPTPQPIGALGTATLALLKTTLDVNADLRYGIASSPAKPQVLAAIDAMAGPIAAMIKAVETVAADRGRLATIPTVGDVPLVLSADALRASDRIAVAHARQVQAIFLTAASTSSKPMDAVPFGCQCAAYTGNPDDDKMFCEARKGTCAGYQIGKKVIPEAAKFIYAIPLSVVMAPVWASNAAWSALRGVAITYTMAIFSGEKPPPIAKVWSDEGGKYITEVVSQGSPVVSATYETVKAMQKVEEIVEKELGPKPDAPKGGLIVGAEPRGDAPNVQVAKVFVTDQQGTSDAITIGVPTTESDKTLAEATLPPTNPSRFNGTYTRVDQTTLWASYDVFPGFIGHEELPPATSTITIANGAIGGGPTTIAASGSYSHSYPAVGGSTCIESGRFWEDGTEAGASGSSNCSEGTQSGTHFGSRGTWTATRVKK